MLPLDVVKEDGGKRKTSQSLDLRARGNTGAGGGEEPGDGQGLFPNLRQWTLMMCTWENVQMAVA